MEPSWWSVIPVAAVVSALVTLAIRWLDKPRPAFAFEQQLNVNTAVSPDNPMLIGAVAVTNVGDGAAFDIELVGDWCDVAVDLGGLSEWHSNRLATRLARIAPGETVLVQTGVTKGDIDRARLVMSWDPSPGRPLPRVRRKMLHVSLAGIASAMPFPVGMFVPSGLPRHWRRWRRLGLHTERGRLSSARGQRAAARRQAAEKQR